MDKEKIKKAILDAAGNPIIGPIAEMADAMAEAVVNIDKTETKKFEPVKETRVQEVKETR